MGRVLPEQKVPSASHYIRSKPECLVHLRTPQLPHLWNENSAHFITNVLQGLHEGTLSVVITEDENAVTRGCPTWQATGHSPSQQFQNLCWRFSAWTLTTSSHHPHFCKRVFPLPWVTWIIKLPEGMPGSNPIFQTFHYGKLQTYPKKQREQHKLTAHAHHPGSMVVRRPPWSFTRLTPTSL